jgi:hypothetical protein
MNKYRSKDRRDIPGGICRRFHCSQAKAYKKPPRPSSNPNAKRRDNPGRDRFDCNGKLLIRCRTTPYREDLTEIHVSLMHDCQHEPYSEVSIPEETQNLSTQDSTNVLDFDLAKKGKVQSATSEGQGSNDANKDVSKSKRDSISDRKSEESGKEEEAGGNDIDEMEKWRRETAFELYDLADIISYQAQFGDRRILKAIKEQFGGLLELAECIRDGGDLASLDSIPEPPPFTEEDLALFRPRPMERILAVRACYSHLL